MFLLKFAVFHSIISSAINDLCRDGKECSVVRYDYINKSTFLKSYGELSDEEPDVRYNVQDALTCSILCDEDLECHAFQYLEIPRECHLGTGYEEAFSEHSESSDVRVLYIKSRAPDSDTVPKGEEDEAPACQEDLDKALEEHRRLEREAREAAATTGSSDAPSSSLADTQTESSTMNDKQVTDTSTDHQSSTSNEDVAGTEEQNNCMVLESATDEMTTNVDSPTSSPTEQSTGGRTTSEPDATSADEMEIDTSAGPSVTTTLSVPTTPQTYDFHGAKRTKEVVCNTLDICTCPRGKLRIVTTLTNPIIYPAESVRFDSRTGKWFVVSAAIKGFLDPPNKVVTMECIDN
ncbi:hypothetical protein PMAYCL1PPCAC_22656 [Pristionchus mayeri]|uniref:Apple domain-containing protein n=1 Tax=Pristionchus mayeri TaxID=1317129 RepID=A0AAN5CWR6_9BILA|nr:hypothetical protein PMAYCL1PPCAC_22656 [Pristionchus mayeri]